MVGEETKPVESLAERNGRVFCVNGGGGGNNGMRVQTMTMMILAGCFFLFAGAWFENFIRVSSCGPSPSMRLRVSFLRGFSCL